MKSFFSFSSCQSICRKEDDYTTANKLKKAPTLQKKATLQNAMRTSTKRIKDFHKDEDDVSPLTERALEKMDRFTRFEKMFPFYRMDVNGFIFKLKEALNLELCNHKKARNIFEVEYICLKSLAQAFSTHSSWKDLSDPNSQFVSFLNDSCGMKE